MIRIIQMIAKTLILAIALAVFTAQMFRIPGTQIDVEFILGTLLASGIIAFITGLPRSGTIHFTSLHAQSPLTHALSLFTFFLALGLNITALILFANAKDGTPEVSGSGLGWIYYLLSLVAWIFTFYPYFGKQPGEDTQAKISSPEMYGIIVIVILGAVFRFHLIASYPYGAWFDEAQNTIVATQILESDHYRPVFIADWTQLPALAFYFFAAAVECLGVGDSPVLAVRVVTTFVGIAALVATWLLGRELFSARVGLCAAAILACSRWHVDFSRFGVNNIFTTLFIPLIFLFLFRALKRSSVRDSMFCGLCLGIGLQFYYAMVAIPVAVVIITALFCSEVLFKENQSVSGAKKEIAKPIGMLLGLCAITFITAAFTYSHVLQYAITHWGQFSERMNTVSTIKPGFFGEVATFLSHPFDPPSETLAVIIESASKHLQMFHFTGDSNGRHNLPGEPMLDPVTGALFAVGIAWALWKFFRPSYALLILWCCGVISAGIFSLSFEAPQSARALGMTPAISILAALPLSQVFLFFRQNKLRWVGFIISGAILAVASFLNWRTYFYTQRFDPSTWSAWSTAETKIGQVIRDTKEVTDFYAVPELIGNPTEKLIAGDSYRIHSYAGVKDLPLEPSGNAAVFFLKADDTGSVSNIKRLYPGAAFENFGLVLPDGSMPKPILIIARISQSDRLSVQGWNATYLDKAKKTRTATLHSGEASWSDFTEIVHGKVVLEGVLKIHDYGSYELVVEHDRHAEVTLDGEQQPSLTKNISRPLNLAKGMHRVKITTTATDLRGSLKVLLKYPDKKEFISIPQGILYKPFVFEGALLGKYYEGSEFTEPPKFEQIDPQIASYFHIIPLPRPFSIKWTGEIWIEKSDAYILGTSSIDDAEIILDGKSIVHSDGRESYARAAVQLSQGWHRIEVRYRAINGYSQIYLYWQKRDKEREIVPAGVLRPAGPEGRQHSW